MGDIMPAEAIEKLDTFCNVLNQLIHGMNSGSFESVDEYKAVYRIAWLYNQFGQPDQAAIQQYAQERRVPRELQRSFWH